MIRKKVDTVAEALEGIQSGMTLMLGGFGLCGIPENLIKAGALVGMRNMRLAMVKIGCIKPLPACRKSLIKQA